MSKLTWALAALLLTVSQAAFGFNAAGHKIVAEIAWRKLSEEQRSAIVTILRAHPRFVDDFQDKMPDEIASQGTAAQDHWIFCQAAIWPDVARKTPDDRPFWHFINLPVFLDAGQAEDFRDNLTVNVALSLEDNAGQPSMNGVQAVKNSLNVVTSSTASDAEKAVHYCWLLHVIPDLAQPLHSAALFTVELFPGGDKGGGKIFVRRQGAGGRGEKLHGVWDSLLLKSSNFNTVLGKADQIVAAHAAEFNAPFIALPNDVWATESQALALQFAYGPILDEIRQAEEDGEELGVIEIPESYFEQAGTVLRKQAVTAGVRLAGVLAGSLPALEGPVAALASAEVGFPAVVASSRAKPVAATEAAAPAAPVAAADATDAESLARRVQRLEAEVRRLRSLVERAGAAERPARMRGGVLTIRERAAAAHDDGEQCDCPLDEE
jgi:hypothetical protein